MSSAVRDAADAEMPGGPTRRPHVEVSAACAIAPAPTTALDTFGGVTPKVPFTDSPIDLSASAVSTGAAPATSVTKLRHTPALQSAGKRRRSTKAPPSFVAADDEDWGAGEGDDEGVGAHAGSSGAAAPSGKSPKVRLTRDYRLTLRTLPAPTPSSVPASDLVHSRGGRGHPPRGTCGRHEAGVEPRRGTAHRPHRQAGASADEGEYPRWLPPPLLCFAPQVRERYINHLDPSIKRGPFLAFEVRSMMLGEAVICSCDATPRLRPQDRVIWALHASLGARWAEIAKSLPGRTENSVKNRFYAAARKVRACEWVTLLLPHPSASTRRRRPRCTVRQRRPRAQGPRGRARQHAPAADCGRRGTLARGDALLRQRRGGGGARRGGGRGSRGGRAAGGPPRSRCWRAGGGCC